jgi:hypothetical protein
MRETRGVNRLFGKGRDLARLAATQAAALAGDTRSLKNKILFVDNFQVKQLNRLVPPGNLWL